ncbi:MAG TPA: S8 family serine peptidase, partial [Roseiflexaceae bacterium]
MGLLVALPWLHYGPLGSPLDTLLDLLAALSLGLFAGVLLDRFLLGPLVAHTSGALRDVGFGGVAAGVALLVLGAGFGYGGSQIPLLIVLAPLGGAALAIGRLTTETTEITEKKMGSDLLPSSVPPVPSATQIATENTEITEKEIGSDPAQPSVRSVLSVARSGWLPIAALVGVAAAGPLLFLDPDEFSLALGLFEVGQALWAAWLALLIATLLGLALWALAAWRRRPLGALPALGGLVAAIAAAALVYGYAGRPGFYGEQLFVVLRDQADVSQAAKIADRTERLRSVYTTLTRHADTTQADLRATLDSLGVAYRPYYLVNGLEVDGGPLLRAYLATRPEVERILDNPRLRPLSGAESPLTGTSPAPEEPQWNVIAIGADRVWDDLGVTGKGIVVGESDSGVQGDHPALRDSYRGRGGRDDYSWLDPWNHSTAPVDVGGHGTHTTGSIVGRGGIGVAPGAEWIGCVNLARNLGNPAYYLDCLQFMLAPYPRSGDPFKDGDPARAAHVLNNSWGCPPIEGCDPGSLLPAVRALRAAGIFVVASAGNEGPRCSSVEDPIAIYDAVFSVGAIDQDGNLADFSSRGPVTVDGSDRVKPDIVAPGVDVLSALPGGTYGPLDGT